MEKAALSLDVIPVVGVVVWRQMLDRSCHEVRDNGIKRYAASRDQDSCLACRTECRLHPSRPHFPVHGETRIHLANRAIGSDREATLACPLLSVCYRICDRRHAYVMERPIVPLRNLPQGVLITQQVVLAVGQVESDFQGVLQNIEPGFRYDPAPVRHADDQCTGTSFPSVAQAQIGHAGVSLAAVQPQLPDDMFGPPVGNALCHLCGELIRRITKKKQIRLENHDILPRLAILGVPGGKFCQLLLNFFQFANYFLRFCEIFDENCSLGMPQCNRFACCSATL